MRLLDAVAFLTRIPVRRAPTLDDVARAQAWFPAVGLVIGLLLLAINEAARRALPTESVDVMLVVALAVLTGALHLDGLADAADGLVGGHDREQRLAIMRDVHVGTFGVVAIISVLALKWAGLHGLPQEVRSETLIMAPCAARAGLLVCIAAFPYARESGTGAGFREHDRSLGPAITLALTACLALALFGIGGSLVFGCAIAVTLGVGIVSYALIRGITGDVYGAAVEIAEAATLLFVAAMANRDWLSDWGSFERLTTWY
jgi:adenosylcobinamide-GDP ribazoletransferase